jgi:hypothetical protein
MFTVPEHCHTGMVYISVTRRRGTWMVYISVTRRRTPGGTINYDGNGLRRGERMESEIMISRCFRNFKIYRIQRWGGGEGGGITTKLT